MSMVHKQVTQVLAPSEAPSAGSGEKQRWKRERREMLRNQGETEPRWHFIQLTDITMGAIRQEDVKKVKTSQNG